jgi:hypothetical protein
MSVFDYQFHTRVKRDFNLHQPLHGLPPQVAGCTLRKPNDILFIFCQNCFWSQTNQGEKDITNFRKAGHRFRLISVSNLIISATATIFFGIIL